MAELLGRLSSNGHYEDVDWKWILIDIYSGTRKYGKYEFVDVKEKSIGFSDGSAFRMDQNVWIDLTDFFNDGAKNYQWETEKLKNGEKSVWRHESRQAIGFL